MKYKERPTNSTRDWETTVAKCKDQPADINVKKEAVVDAKVDEEEERKWLTEMERVEARVFDGRVLAKTSKAKTNKEIATELYDRADRRIGKNTTVMVDGFAISKESMNCGDWEAVPTFAGKDPRLAEPKRAKKAKVENQPHCQVCYDGGEVYLCQICPRAFHMDCLQPEFKQKAKGWSFNCPQHECHDCSQKTTDAGGMLYRCRSCERAYCEDCLDFDKITLIGNNLMEYELLGAPEQSQAFYIQCSSCTEHFLEHPEDKEVVTSFEAEVAKEYEARFGAQAEEVRDVSRAGSMTDATSIETPSFTTPAVTPGRRTPSYIVIDDDDDDLDYEVSASNKRKLKLTLSHGGSASKRERLAKY